MQLTEMPEESAGGIWLPASARQNWTEGTVRAAGPGEETGWSRPTVMWADPGDTVLFQKQHYRSLGGDAHEGLVRDDHLVAIIASDGEVLPCNDWVQIRQDPDILTDGIIVYAEEWRPKPMHGVVHDHGPGRLRQRGELAGTRCPVEQLVGQALRHRRVWWDHRVEVLAIGREALEWVLIQAGDLMGVEA